MIPCSRVTDTLIVQVILTDWGNDQKAMFSDAALKICRKKMPAYAWDAAAALILTSIYAAHPQRCEFTLLPL